MGSIPICKTTTPLQQFLAENPTVSSVRCLWVDLSGALRVRQVPTDRCLQLSANNKPIRLPPSGGMDFIKTCDVSEIYRPGGFDSIYPEWSTIRLASIKYASVLCNYLEEMVTHSDLEGLGTYARCPRTALKQVVSLARDSWGVEMTAGFGLEFWLVRPEALQEGQTANMPAPVLSSEYGSCIEQCVENLQTAGVEVEAYHQEAGWQQFEIATGPLPILSSVDTMIQSQDIIRATAFAHGFRATFYPKPFPDLPSSGLHCHLSFRQATDAPESTSSQEFNENAFLAGILHRLPLLCAFSMPNEQSYSRVGSGMAGTWVAWGSGNRAASVRKINHRHFELRTLDATANIYIALATFVGAGTLGVQENRDLHWRDCNKLIDRLDEEERREFGIDTKLPASLEKSIDLLEACKAKGYMELDQVLEQGMLDLYSSCKALEFKNVERMNEKERRAMYLRLF